MELFSAKWENEERRNAAGNLVRVGAVPSVFDSGYYSFPDTPLERVGAVPYGLDPRNKTAPLVKKAPGVEQHSLNMSAIPVLYAKRCMQNIPNWSRILVRGLGFIHISTRPNKPRPNAAMLARNDGRVLVSRLRVRPGVTARCKYPYVTFWPYVWLGSVGQLKRDEAGKHSGRLSLEVLGQILQSLRSICLIKVKLKLIRMQVRRKLSLFRRWVALGDVRNSRAYALRQQKLDRCEEQKKHQLPRGGCYNKDLIPLCGDVEPHPGMQTSMCFNKDLIPLCGDVEPHPGMLTGMT